MWHIFDHMRLGCTEPHLLIYAACRKLVLMQYSTNVEGCRNCSAKTTATVCRDGRVRERQGCETTGLATAISFTISGSKTLLYMVLLGQTSHIQGSHMTILQIQAGLLHSVHQNVGIMIPLEEKEEEEEE